MLQYYNNPDQAPNRRIVTEVAHRGYMSPECTVSTYRKSDAAQCLTNQNLREQTEAFQGTGGTSNESRDLGFLPAFLDTETGAIYLSRFFDGKQAPLHMIDGLPEEVAATRDSEGKTTAVKSSVIAGFVRYDQFYTREQAAAAVSD